MRRSRRASSAGPSDLGTRLSKALAVPHAGITAAVAVDLTTGETLFSRQEQLALVPASNEKLAVTYAACLGSLDTGYALRLVGQNDAGAFTGGHADNVVRVTVLYGVYNELTGLFE